MIWIILMIVPVISFATALFAEYGKDTRIKKSIIAALFPLIGFVVSVGLVHVIAQKPSYSEQANLISTTEIVSVSNSKEVEGKIKGQNNLLYGYIDGNETTESYYNLMVMNGDTAEIKKVKSDEIKLIFITDEETKPHIDEYAYSQVPTEVDKTLVFWLTFFEPKYEKKPETEMSYKTAYYEVYVPKDSISTDFNLL